jgi:hypothetical protein
MASAKDIIVKPIKSSIANEFVKKHHYSGKVVNSQLHFGCFLNGVLGGVMSFGPSLDKRHIQGLVKDTPFNDFLELNRMAFSDLLPRNSESRCLSIAFKMIKKYYPNIKWIVSFADGCQCGDGTIYRASGFKLTGIKKNKTMLINEKGDIRADLYFNINNLRDLKKTYKPLDGYMLRYIYFIDKSKEKDLTVPILPFSMIDEMNARMYKGVSYKRNASLVQEQNSNFPVENGGATPTDSLHNIGENND